MIRVDLPHMLSGYNALKDIKTRLADKRAAAEEVLARLSSPEMESIRAALKKTISEMDDNCYSLSVLMQTADTVCRYYSLCENRIIDNCEYPRSTYAMRQTGFTSLSGVSALLDSLKT